MFDYHIHTRLCRHATGSMEEYVEAAVKRGLNEICFTPHSPMPGLYGTNLRMDLEEFDIYLNDIERVKKQFKEINILTGIEADYYAGYEDFLAGFLSGYPFDLVHMSIHFIRHWPEGQWVFNLDPARPLHEIYRDYFNALEEGIKTGLFDSVAHFDLIKQPGHPVLKSNIKDVEKIIDLCCRNGLSIEINTGGLRKEIGEIFPSTDIIGLMISRGVSMTLGSDAHTPSQVAFRFEETAEWLKKYPEAKMVRYKKRKAYSYRYA